MTSQHKSHKQTGCMKCAVNKNFMNNEHTKCTEWPVNKNLKHKHLMYFRRDCEAGEHHKVVHQEYDSTKASMLRWKESSPPNWTLWLAVQTCKEVVVCVWLLANSFAYSSTLFTTRGALEQVLWLQKSYRWIRGPYLAAQFDEIVRGPRHFLKSH